MNEKNIKSSPNPYEKANIFSKITFSFISPLLSLGKKRPLKDEDLFDLVESDESKYLAEKLQM